MPMADRNSFSDPLPRDRGGLLSVEGPVRRWKTEQGRVPEEALRVVRRGGVLVFPTETVYGLGGNPLDKNVIRKIFSIKERPEGKPLPLVAAHREAVLRGVAWWPQAARALAAKFWPGPLTLVLPAAPLFPQELLSDEGTVAVRISPHPVPRQLAEACGGWIIATSANLSGEPPTRDPENLSRELLRRVDGLVDGGGLEKEVPSTVVELLRGGTLRWRCLRRGAVEMEDVARVLGVNALESGD
ncbi:MAG: threonylcarbamoyl-AMP synthase [Desulfacinum sp.]|nr:threonylcarbamoyl-AMP synthase [Desulfacinum sp.]